MPAAWQEHAVVALRGEVYVLGGFNPDATDRVVVYDPSADEWRDVAAFPEVFQHANAAAIDDRIYVAGYYVGASFSDVSGATYAFDPDANDWTPREPMPQGTERSSACVAALDGLMYVFGGANGGAVIDASVYDPEQDSWEVLAPLPEPREHCTAAGIDGRVFIAAGRSGGLSSFVATTLVYDPDVRTYDELEPISTPRGGVAGAALGSRFVVFGGEGNEGTSSGVFPDVEALDTTTGAWEVLPEMLLPRHGLGAAVIDGRIYLPGGATTQGFGAALDHTAAWFE
jgi:N-acetylneuraminic acid mutarotase